MRHQHRISARVFEPAPRELAACTAVVRPDGGPAHRNPVLERPQDLPSWWHEASAALDALPPGGRVLQLPGTESAVSRWGTTIDPILPGLSDRQLISRDWLPLGSAAAMDLSYALEGVAMIHGN